MVKLSTPVGLVNRIRPYVTPTYTETLGASRSKAVRTLKYTPSDAAPNAGTAEIITARVRGGKSSSETYTVVEFAPGKDFEGRAFRFTKPDGETRNVFLCRKGDHSCDCEGFTYAAKERADRRHRLTGEAVPVCDSLGCKHLDTGRVLIENRWIGRPSAVVAVPVPAFPVGADGDIPNPLDAACDWCAGTEFIPDGNGQLFPCPMCCPHGIAPALNAA